MKHRRSKRSRLWRGTKNVGAEGVAGCGCDVLSCVTVLVGGVATLVAGRATVAVVRRRP